MRSLICPAIFQGGEYEADNKGLGSATNDGSTRVTTSAGQSEDYLLHARAAEDPVASQLWDLSNFRMALEVPLEAAQQALDVADPDLAAALREGRSRAEKLINEAQKAAMDNAIASQYQSLQTLPNLRAAIAQRKMDEATSLLGMSQAWICDVKTRAQSLRVSYVTLLEYLQYLMHCTNVTGDLVIMAGQDHAINVLDIAFGQLRQAAQVMENCSYFWLRLHSGKQIMVVLEKRAKEMFSSAQNIMTMNKGQVAIQGDMLAPSVMELIRRLDEACQQYCSTEMLAIIAREAPGDLVEYRY